MKRADNPKLQHAHKQQEVVLFGLPLKIFALAALCGGFLLLLALMHLGWLFGLLIGGLCGVAIFAPLRWAHKHDLRAWELWLHAYFGQFTKETLLKKRHVHHDATWCHALPTMEKYNMINVQKKN
uniref:Uncharacterized protein n=1 Tax=Vibrio tasmaniensis TaxID=212663 RepID=A0A0H3ZUG2_9VIBR|nr:hypothetical protein [Vibrio tasmaniensis]